MQPRHSLELCCFRASASRRDPETASFQGRLRQTLTELRVATVEGDIEPARMTQLSCRWVMPRPWHRVDCVGFVPLRCRVRGPRAARWQDAIKAWSLTPYRVSCVFPVVGNTVPWLMLLAPQLTQPRVGWCSTRTFRGGRFTPTPRLATCSVGARCPFHPLSFFYPLSQSPSRVVHICVHLWLFLSTHPAPPVLRSLPRAFLFCSVSCCLALSFFLCYMSCREQDAVCGWPPASCVLWF